MEDLKLQLPFSRVKRICKLDPSMNNISLDAVKLLTLATVSLGKLYYVELNILLVCYQNRTFTFSGKVHFVIGKGRWQMGTGQFAQNHSDC